MSVLNGQKLKIVKHVQTKNRNMNYNSYMYCTDENERKKKKKKRKVGEGESSGGHRRSGGSVVTAEVGYR